MNIQRTTGPAWWWEAAKMLAKGCTVGMLDCLRFGMNIRRDHGRPIRWRGVLHDAAWLWPHVFWPPNVKRYLDEWKRIDAEDEARRQATATR